ncbi:DUF4083 family protein [Siminovitchia sp. 179-K 8D1 HS]|uniref:DUF4083 family protein n=1 Tax=Siminovitchia sp. 179-K 8D1 HS TaxID=3142385 RepID=UPI0039A33F68
MHVVNFGDIIFQLAILLFLLGIFAALFFLFRLLITKQKGKQNNIEQKLDRIIDLLEKDKKE